MVVKRGLRAVLSSLTARWAGTAVLLFGLLIVPSVCQAQSSTMLVETNVAEATIQVDGETVGQTNQEGTALLDSLESGPHTVKLQKSGYWTASSQVQLESELTTTVSLTLTRRPTDTGGTLRVETTVEGAIVLVDGRQVGRTDSTGQIQTSELGMGAHEVIVYKDGYAQASQQVTLDESTPNRTVRLPLSPPATASRPSSDSLTARSGSLTTAAGSPRSDSAATAPRENAGLVVDTGVPDATVFVNDSTRGTTDTNGLLALQVSPGTHQVEVRKEGYKPTRSTTQLDAGTQNTLAFSPTRISSSEDASLIWHLSDTWVLLLIGILIGLSSLAVAFLVLSNGDDDAFRWPWSYKRFDQYDLSSVLQRTELSTVYLANTPEHGRVTLTVLDDPYASEPAQAESFLNKGRTLKQIHETDPDAPVIDVYRVGRENDADDGRPFIVLEHLEGESLLSHLKDIDTLDTGEALSITRQVCSALQVAHNNNVHHGNLTPENVVVTQTDPYRIKLVGFGLQSQGAAQHDLAGGITSYLSPEQLRDGRSDWRSDMYAVGMLFYKLVTGAPPHMSDSSTQMLEYQAEDPTPPLPDHIPDHVKPVFHRMISNDPDRRPTPTRVISVLDLLQSTT